NNPDPGERFQQMRDYRVTWEQPSIDGRCKMTQDGGSEYHPREQFADDCRLPPSLHQIGEHPAGEQQRADLDEKMKNLKLAETLHPTTARGLTRRARRFLEPTTRRGAGAIFSLTGEEKLGLAMDARGSGVGSTDRELVRLCRLCVERSPGWRLRCRPRI